MAEYGHVEQEVTTTIDRERGLYQAVVTCSCGAQFIARDETRSRARFEARRRHWQHREDYL